MNKYCIVDEYGKAYIGTKADVLAAVCEMKLVGDSRELYYKFAGHLGTTVHGYGADFSDFEAASDAVNFVWGKLPQYGFRVFQSI